MTSLRTCIVLAPALLVAAWAQVPPDAERVVSGFVLDGETLQPVPDVSVSLVLQDSPGVRAGVAPFGQDAGTTVSSAGGTFAFRLTEAAPGMPFSLRAEHDGYAMPNAFGIPGLFDYSGRLNASGATEVRLRLYRVNRLAGRLVDDETRLPVEGVRVQVWNGHYWQGRRRSFPADETATTDSEGRFALNNLLPGQHLLRIEPASATGYPATFWPGAYGDAHSISLAFGATVDLGDIRLRRGELSELRLTTPEGVCEPGETVLVRLHQSLSGVLSTRANREMQCGTDVLVGGLEAGSYVLTARTSSKNPRRFRTRVDVTGRQQDVALDLVTGLTVAGQITLPEGAPSSTLDPIRISHRPVNSALEGEAPRPTLDPNGRFELAGLEPGAYAIAIQGIPKGFYVEEMAYNGAVVEGGILHVQAGALDQSLKISLSPGTGVVSGEAPERSRVFLLRRIVERFWFQNLATVDPEGDGSFRLEGVAPGSYWAFAVALDEAERLHEPGVLAGWVARAREIEVRRNQNIRVNLD